MSASASKGGRRSFNRRDFGLGQRKIAVPGVEGNGRVLLASPTGNPAAEPSKKKKVKRRSVGERVMDMFHLKKRGEGEQKATLPVVPPSPQQALRNNLQSLPTSSGNSPRASSRFTPTPSPLRSRALRRQVFTAEQHDSLQAVMHEYGYKKDGTPMLGRKKMQPEDKMVRLKIKSNGKDKDDPITLIKDDEGTGIHLSTGLPPFSVTYVEPGSKGMLAGIRVGDVIVEVNGRDCSLMDDNLELTDVMELKSIITHIPGSRPGSRPGSAMSGRKYINGGHIGISSIDSDTDSSDEGDDEEDHHWNGNGQRRKKKITKGVWNRIKAEGLHDSDSESSGSFVNLVMESSSDEDDFIDKWNERALNKEKEIEIDDSQWRQMRQKQNLIFNRDAPSYMISNPPQKNGLSHQHQLQSSTNPLTDEPLASKKKRHFKWPFTRPVTSVKPPSHKQVKKTRNAANSPRTKSPLESVLIADLSGAKILKSTDDNASNTGDSDNSSLFERPHILEKATVEGRTKKSSHSRDSVPKRPSRSQSLIEKGRKLPVRTKRLSKEAPPDISVERTTPLLGVSDGRNKRDLARARKVRRPTTKGKSGGEKGGEGGRVEGGGATLVTGQSGDELVILQEQSTNMNSTSHHIISKAVSDPGNTSHNSQENPETTQKSMKRRSTASLVEEAVRKRSLAQKEEKEEKEVSTSRRRKHAVAPYAIETSVAHKLSAQVVANAAAMKAKEIQHKQQKKEHKVKETKEEQVPLAHKKLRQDKLAQMSALHPLHKSRSFQDERDKGRGRTEEATWISLAKAKHEKMTEEFNQKSGARSRKEGEPHLYDRKARLSINRSVSLHDEMDTVGD